MLYEVITPFSLCALLRSLQFSLPRPVSIPLLFSPDRPEISSGQDSLVYSARECSRSLFLFWQEAYLPCIPKLKALHPYRTPPEQPNRYQYLFLCVITSYSIHYTKLYEGKNQTMICYIFRQVFLQSVLRSGQLSCNRSYFLFWS